jgi:uncharacterized membrane protein
MMTTIERSIEVDVPISVAYDQWTQFEDFPHFMEGVEQVRQLDDTHLHWEAEIAGVRREWDAEITEQRPDTCVAWRSLDGTRNAGTVTFAPLDADRTAVVLQLDIEPEGFAERPAERSASSSAELRATSSGSRSSSRAAGSRPAPGAGSSTTARGASDRRRS